jgi:hypothetical protein
MHWIDSRLRGNDTVKKKPPIEVPRIRNSYGFIFDEYKTYRVTNFFPVVVDHFTYPFVHRLKKLLPDRGLKPTISTHGGGSRSTISITTMIPNGTGEF